MTSLISQQLFAYGTLQSGHPEHDRFCGQALSVQPARIAARLFVLREGYPVLQLPPKSVTVTASENCCHDWRQIAETPLACSPPEKPFRWIEGELIALPLTEDALAAPDAWEGFDPGKVSVYQRVIAPVLLRDGAMAPAWVYVCQAPPETARAVDAARWNRPDPPNY